MVSESASAAPRAPFLVRSTSPVQCVLAFLAGAGLQHALGLPLPPEWIRPALYMAGTVLANTSLVLALWSFAASRIQTSLGAVPGPTQVAQQAVNLVQ